MVWVPAPVPTDTAALIAAGHPPWLAELLARRGVSDGEAAEQFLHPALEQLHDPKQLAGMAAAMECLLEAREADHGVALVGDYDVDGVSGTALLTAVLRACKLRVVPILPHRMKDGYGFQPVHVEKAVAEDCQLVVTVDCGTTSIDATQAAVDAGLRVIVTDHHLPGEGLPPEVILINPQQEACEYPFPDLCGAGIALKVAMAFADACDRPIDPRLLLRIACLGTVADMVPLRGENRVIASLGLVELSRTRSVGLRALIQIAKIRPPMTTEDIGFRIGPRLNAPGRLDSADKALELLLSREPKRAGSLAKDLDAWNRARQRWEQQVSDEAEEMFEQRQPMPAILVGWKEGWHRGVVGIAAGRLARKFHRPVILLAADGDTATGSGRSIEGIHLFDFLNGWREDLVRFGGHAQAIGMTVELKRLSELEAEWSRVAEETWADQIALRRREYEIAFDASEITPELFERLQALEPFGQGNQRPLIRVRGPLRLARTPRFFGRGHLSAQALGPDRGRIQLLGWGWQERAASLEGEFELLGYLELDRYRGGAVMRLAEARPWSEDSIPGI